MNTEFKRIIAGQGIGTRLRVDGAEVMVAAANVDALRNIHAHLFGTSEFFDEGKCGPCLVLPNCGAAPSAPAVMEPTPAKEGTHAAQS